MFQQRWQAVAGLVRPGAFCHRDVGSADYDPVNAMLFRAEGAQVALVDKDGKVHLRPISIGRDFGATLEILGGIEVSDQIVINPSDSLEEGQQVHVAKANAGDAHS